MKRTMSLLIALILALLSANAMGELGYAEIAKENVNVRDAAGGKMLWRLDSPQSVYVFEEKTVAGQLWCRVSTYIGKNPRTGWIRGDMLRFLSDEFTDIVDVIAGETYVMGLRSDGTVAIMGDDMKHAPCIAAVRSWKNIREIGTRICSAYGLTDRGVVRAAGLQENFDGMKAAHIGEGFPYPMDTQGRLDYDEWARVWERGDDARRMLGEALLGDTPLQKIIGDTMKPAGALTKDGRVLLIDFPDSARRMTADVHFVDLSGRHTYIAALREDGRVEVVHTYGGAPECVCVVCTEVGKWTDIVKVEAAGDYVLGLQRSGTVLCAGGDKRLAQQTAAWQGVMDLAAAPECCIALFSDGSVAMAGHHHEGYFR